MARRSVNVMCTLVIVLSLCVVALSASVRFSVIRVTDDAYVYVRYADHLLAGDGLSWNPQDGPAYGLTSVAYLLAVLPMRVAFPDAPCLALMWSSAACGALFVGITFLMACQIAQRAGVSPVIVSAVVALSLCIGSAPMTEHFASGMDTCFAMAFVAGFLCLALRVEAATPTRARMAWLGGAAGLGFAARPDVGLLTVGLLGALTLFSRGQRQRFAEGTAIALVVVAAQLFAAWMYFGTPLPLPFYVKCLPQYGEETLAAFRGMAVTELGLFAKTYALPGAVAVGGLLAALRRRDAVGPLWLSAGACLAAFCVYHAFLVLPVMSGFERFYYPSLPVFLLCVGLGFGSLHRVWGSIRWRPNAWFSRLGYVSVALVLIAYFGSRSILERELGKVIRGLGGYDAYTPVAQYDIMFKKNWFALPAVAKLPDGVVLATTEIGLPCVMYPRKRIVDLSGLNEPTFARKEFDAAWLFSHYHPDWIYLPHHHYAAMIEAIRSAPGYADYVEFPPALLGVDAFGVAIWRGSPYYAEMKELIRANAAKELPK